KTLAVYLPDEPELDCGYPSDCTEEDLARMAYNGMCAEDSVAVFELSVFVGFEPRCMRVRASEPSWTFAVDGPNGSLNEESDSCIVVEASCTISGATILCSSAQRATAQCGSSSISPNSNTAPSLGTPARSPATPDN